MNRKSGAEYVQRDGEKAQATGWARKRRREDLMRCEGKQMTQTGYRYAEMRLRQNQNKCIGIKEQTGILHGRSEVEGPSPEAVPVFSLSFSFQKCISLLRRRPFFLDLSGESPGGFSS